MSDHEEPSLVVPVAVNVHGDPDEPPSRELADGARRLALDMLLDNPRLPVEIRDVVLVASEGRAYVNLQVTLRTALFDDFDPRVLAVLGVAGQALQRGWRIATIDVDEDPDFPAYVEVEIHGVRAQLGGS